MYQRWADSTPAMPFPFQYRNGGDSFKRTWNDVREGFQTEGVSTTIHHSTGHVTTTSMQNAVIQENIRHDRRHLTPRKPADGSSPFLPRANTGSSFDGSTSRGLSDTDRSSDLRQTAREVRGGGDGGSATLAPLLVPSPPARGNSSHASDCAFSARRPCDPTLAAIGRNAYLLAKRRLPYTEDKPTRGFSPASKSYGGALSAVKLPPPNPIFHIKVCGLPDAFRPSGVF